MADARRRHTLLIVDDEEDVLESLRHLFRRRYRVLTAPSGELGLQILAEEEVHLILSDQRMPGMSGDAFLARARRERPEAVRMLFTGYADIQAVILAINEGAIFRYILKPWDPDELEAIVNQAAEHYDLIADRDRLMDELQRANAGLQAANRELAEASQLKSTFLEVASHEFNTPITMVRGLSELLRLIDPDREPEEREIVEQIAEGAGRLSRLIAKTLALMTTEDFRRTLRPAPTDLADLLRRVAEEVTPFVHARRQELRLNLADDLGTFEVDADKVHDAVVNLLTNAIKFTPDGGRISLEAVTDGPDEAEIRVIDQGIGMEPRALRRIFQPFFTEFDPSHHSSGDFGYNKRGLGLGLSLVKRFVDLHGGRVEAVSAPGEGTTVAIHLPRRPRPEAPAPVESAGAAGTA